MKPIIDPAVADEYLQAGYWGTDTLTDVVRRLVDRRPEDPAFVIGSSQTSWARYDAAADALAWSLAACGLAPGEAVGVLLPDGPGVHAAFLATERAGVAAVGLGSRAGAREIDHLLSLSGARALVAGPEHRGVAVSETLARVRAAGAPLEHAVVVDPLWPDQGRPLVDGKALRAPKPQAVADMVQERRLGPNDLFLVNSTSGTTGLPKAVMQFENRWFFFHQLVASAIELTPDDVFMSVIPAPFGFGLWTAHFTPTLAGVPVVLMERYDTEGALELMARERVTVLCCVSTQFIMMLGSKALGGADLSSLRAIFTGGEAVPYHKAAEFEERTGARVLQFYGSNETGAFSYTSMDDSRHDRLTTCGRVIESMAPRLFDQGVDVTASGGPGQPACRGPATCAGYFQDPEANRSLYTPDGWMLMEDIATIDERGYVRLTGRKGDFIIRGGKNISAAAVEDAVGSHPGVALAAAVAVPDEVFGERVGVFVIPAHDGAPTLEQLTAHLERAGHTKETFPEHLFVVDDLPRSSGGKVAKSLLRQEVARRQGPR